MPWPLVEPRMRFVWGLAAFGLLGVVQTLCFDQVPSVWLPWIVWAPLIWLSVLSTWSLRRRLLVAWFCGTVFWSINVGWIAHTIGFHGGLGSALGFGLLMLLALYMGLYWTAFVGIGSWAFKRRRDCADALSAGYAVRTAAGLAGLWVLLEIVREWMFTGFPWSPLGEALVRTPGALDASAWLGVRGLSFTVLVICLLYTSDAADE